MFELTPQHRIYIVLTCTFLTALLVADMTAGKFFYFAGREISVGVIPFPITFLITDVVNEYYGRKGARLLTFIGMGMLLFAFAIITIARFLPVSPHSPVGQQSFDAVFGLSAQFFFASLLAYLVAQVLDIHMFQITKRVTESKHLWLRALGSTAISQVVDTTIVNLAALLPTALTLTEIAHVTVFNYLYKLTVAAALTPLCYVIHDLLTRRLGIEPMPPESIGEGSPAKTP